MDIAQPLTQRAVEWVYGYDWLDRLESVKKREATTVAGLGPAPLQLTSVYQYDAADNRIEFKVPNLQQPELTETFTYGYDDADNVLSISKAVGTGSANEIEAFTSDDDGNLKTRTSGGVTTTYTWNDFNRLAAISTSDNSKKQSHTFGVNGFRRKKKDKNDVETTEYAAGLATAVSKAQAGDTITYLMGHRLMGFERQSDGAMFWFVTDSLSTVRDVVDSSGEVKARYEFSEYGQRIATSENGASSQKTFVGGMSVQDEVADTGLMMMGHRFYAPGVISRFLSRDPIGFSGGLNLFEYASSQPVSTMDPLGLQSEEDSVAILSFHADAWHSWLEYQFIEYDLLGRPYSAEELATMGLGSFTIDKWPRHQGYAINAEKGRKSQGTVSFHINQSQANDFWNYANKTTTWTYSNNCVAFTAGAWETIGAGDPTYRNILGDPAPWVFRDYTLGNGAGGAEGIDGIGERIATQYTDVEKNVLMKAGVVAYVLGGMSNLYVGAIFKNKSMVGRGLDLLIKKPDNIK